MAERKVLNKYFQPDFDASLIKKRKRLTIDTQLNVRMMLPMSIRCGTCGSYQKIGTKYNMRLEKCKDKKYLSISIFRFYFKCTVCYAQICFRTDPKNSDYICESGGNRTYEAGSDFQAATDRLKEMQEEDEEGNAMKFLENRTFNSKREMDMLDALDELKGLTNQRSQLSLDDIIKDLKIIKDDKEETDQKEIEELFEYNVKKQEYDQESDEEDLSLLKGKTDFLSEFQKPKSKVEQKQQQKSLIKMNKLKKQVKQENSNKQNETQSNQSQSTTNSNNKEDIKQDSPSKNENNTQESEQQKTDQQSKAKLLFNYDSDSD